MANLKCDAKNCVHNDSPYCCISQICVGGMRAMSEAETCCDDFREKKDTMSNCACGNDRSAHVDIECKASHCVYNEDRHCKAENVTICGPTACVCDETRCSTFRMR